MARLGHVTLAAAMVYLYLHARSDRDAQLTHALASAMSLRGLGASVGLSPHN
jgi:hypothetical protein